MKVVTTEQMRDLERRSEAEGVTLSTLMENAGHAVASKARELLGGDVRGVQVCVLVGPGNNGGDGLVAARYLNDWGARIHVCLSTPRSADDPNYRAMDERGVAIIQMSRPGGREALAKALGGSRMAIDALLGTGVSRPIAGSLKEALDALCEAKQAHPELVILALDLPSGLNSDTGAVDASCPNADVTVTLGYPKLGLFLFPGAGRVGRLEAVEIGIPAHLAEGIDLEMITPKWAASVLPRRPAGAHKGTFGKVMVVAGSKNYIGAAYLACAAATRVGAGLVTLAAAQSLIPVLASKLTEVTYVPLPESEWGVIRADAFKTLHMAMADYDVLLIGCGLGQQPSTSEFVRQALLTMPKGLAPKLVLDADGLNIVARVPEWWRNIDREMVLTPHSGEMHRLVDRPIEEIERDRLKTAREAAAGWKKTVVLKGAHTVVAAPVGKAMLSPFANPGLASAGTGDVLAGAIAGLLGQGLSTFNAAACGVYLHAAAGQAVSEEIGDAGMVASDLLPILPKTIKKLKSTQG